MANIINFVEPVASKLLVKVIAWLVGICGSIWLGVILFTLALKLITLPFDFISRSKMRKNSILMEEMRPELEKLQKQYANNKQLYNQKMMALYKKNGYSMWGACLPTIITLVIFIIAISAFTNYSNYQNRKYFYEMSLSYNSVVYDGFEADGTYIIENEDGSLTFKDKELYELTDDIPHGFDTTKEIQTAKIYKVDKDGNNVFDYMAVRTKDGYMEYRVYISSNGEFYSKYYIVEENLALEENFGSTYTNFKNARAGQEVDKIAYDFILDCQQQAAADTFRAQDKKFLWVKNIWVTDSPTKHPIETDWVTFKKTYEYKDPYNLGAEDYASLIAKLDVEKTQPNGYLILVALTILTSVLTQWITSKSQKAQMELQTVDGQGAKTNKMMMWMMPIMMAIFAFIYTAAFSLYIVLSSVLSVLTTLLINFIVEKKYKKQVEALNARKDVVRGRVYTPPKQEEKPKETKKKKKEEIPKNDFLSGLADRKKGKK